MSHWQPARPYNSLPGLPPGVELESRAILKACIEARAALATLKEATRRIPNASVLINAIPLLEARASTEIENIVTTTDAVFRHADMASAADPATKEALRYRTALREGFASLQHRPVCTGTAERTCSIIKDADMRVRAVPGTDLGNPMTGEVIYTPPEGEDRLRTMLANWERFLHDATDRDPLVTMAAAHYQFEAIHPFTDGNGRTGRLLNLLLIVEAGLLDVPVLYLSRHILQHKVEYQRRLLAVTTEHAWEPWVRFMLASVQETSRWTTQRIASICELMQLTQDHVRRAAPKIYTRELVELIFVQPYCRIGNLVDAGIAKRQTASAHLKTLVELGVLQEQKAGRDKLFVHPRFLDLLASEQHTVVPYGDSAGVTRG